MGPEGNNSLKGENVRETGKTRSRAIRAKCLDCCGGDKVTVRCCACVDCPLWHFRCGRRPTGGFLAYIDREFFARYIDIPQRGFSRLLLAEAHQRAKNEALSVGIFAPSMP